MKYSSRSTRKASSTHSRRPRQYLQAARKRQTDSNTLRIVEAATSLVCSGVRISEISLNDIAVASRITVRTILRRFGSRDGVLEAAFSQLAQKLKRDRSPTPPGEIDVALGSLLRQYEQDGDLHIKALEKEGELPLLHKMMEYARAQHRAWIVETFAPHLARLSRAAREQRITELHAATDVCLWKLLRRDLRIGKKQTEIAFRNLVYGLVRLNDGPPGS